MAEGGVLCEKGALKEFFKFPFFNWDFLVLEVGESMRKNHSWSLTFGLKEV